MDSDSVSPVISLSLMISLICLFVQFAFTIVLQKGLYTDLLATSGDYLRVWRAGEPDTRLECVLNNVSYLLFS